MNERMLKEMINKRLKKLLLEDHLSNPKDKLSFINSKWESLPEEEKKRLNSTIDYLYREVEKIINY